MQARPGLYRWCHATSPRLVIFVGGPWEIFLRAALATGALIGTLSITHCPSRFANLFRLFESLAICAVLLEVFFGNCSLFTRRDRCVVLGIMWLPLRSQGLHRSSSKPVATACFMLFAGGVPAHLYDLYRFTTIWIRFMQKATGTRSPRRFVASAMSDSEPELMSTLADAYRSAFETPLKAVYCTKVFT